MADPHHTGSSDTPLVKLMVSMSGASGAEHETEPPGASPVSLTAGHEPDRFDVRGILYVPAFVVIVVGLAYVVVTSLFSGGFVHKDDPKTAKNPFGAQQNQAAINDRVGRISSTNPKALDGLPGTSVPQPRLEALRQTGQDGPDGDPPHLRSKRPIGEGNSPEYRPEDLRAKNYHDPATGKRVLAEYEVDAKTKTNVVPIDVAMKVVATPGKLPTKKGTDGKPVAGPSATSDGKAKPSNSGFGPPSAPKAPEKHEENHKH